MCNVHVAAQQTVDASPEIGILAATDQSRVFVFRSSTFGMFQHDDHQYLDQSVSRPVSIVTSHLSSVCRICPHCTVQYIQQHYSLYYSNFVVLNMFSCL